VETSPYLDTTIHSQFWRYRRAAMQRVWYAQLSASSNPKATAATNGV